MKPLTLRRLRLTPALRELTREVRVSAAQMIQPHFVVEGLTGREPVDGMPRIYRETSDSLLEQIDTDLAAGVDKFMLFAVPGAKAERDFDFGFAADRIAAIKARFGDRIWLVVDVCLCSHTTHGHCGIINDAGDYVLNAESVEELTRAAVEYARAGADCVAPSDMMDGRVGAIRAALDGNGLDRTVIMSYAAKFHSGFYGPFRDAAESSPGADSRLHDRASYQLDPARPGDALASARRDADEGADILMVKPGLPCLDILATLSASIHKPWAVYQVSGEYAAIEALAERGLADGPRAHVEAWTAFARAGATAIISYAARSARDWLDTAPR